jgi:hypothetical protein
LLQRSLALTYCLRPTHREFWKPDGGLLLTTCRSETMSRIESQSRDQHEKLFTCLSQNNEELSKAREELSNARNEATESHSKLAADVQAVREELKTSNQRLDNISSAAASLKSSIMTLGNIGRQILLFISTFPVEVRDLLKTIVRSNVQMYTLLLSTQANISTNPTILLQSNIHFEDALGRTRELPFEWFRHWEVGFHASDNIRVLISTRPSTAFSLRSSRMSQERL